MIKLNKKYREDASNGNQYPEEDYACCVREIFANFDLEFSSITLLRGCSQAPDIRSTTLKLEFDLVYIDGGHRYDEVLEDINFYGERIKAGGYLVLDDASYFQPGKTFWKGHESVSRAAEEINRNKFSNILNIGHNRIYQRHTPAR